MTKKRTFSLIFLLLLGGVSLTVSAAEKKGLLFVPENGDYSIEIPYGWRYAGTAEQLQPGAEKLAEELKDAKIKVMPSIALKGPRGGLNGLVSEPLPKDTELTEAEKKEYLTAMAVLIGMPDGRLVRGKNSIFIVNQSTNETGAVALKAITVGKDRLYAFSGGVLAEKADTDLPVLIQTLFSVSFDEGDIAEAKRQYQERAVGFVTGLWHGALLPFRLISAIFSDIEVVAKHNAGLPYWLGYALGVIILIAVLAPKRAKPLPSDEDEDVEESKPDSPAEEAKA